MIVTDHRIQATTGLQPDLSVTSLATSILVLWRSPRQQTGPHTLCLQFFAGFSLFALQIVSILLCLSLCPRRLMSMDASIGCYPLLSNWVCQGGSEWNGRGQWIYLPISYPARLCNASGCMFRPKAIESIRQPSAIATGLPGSRGVCRSTLPSLWVLSYPLLVS